MKKDLMVRNCSYCGSGKKVLFSTKYGDYLCNRHYMQMYHTGILKERFKKDKNKIEVEEDSVKIYLYYMGKYDKIAIIDREDAEKVSGIKWSFHYK